MRSLIVAFAGEQLISPDGHVPSVGWRRLELSVDGSKHLLGGKCPPVADGDPGQIWRTRGEEWLYRTVAIGIQSMAARAGRGRHRD
jgi:hypothetical protein